MHGGRRVVVTGVGVVSPLGADADTTWKGLLAGRSGISTIQRFDASQYASRIAGECRDFDAEKYIEKKRLREGDRFIHLAVGAADQAVRSYFVAVAPDVHVIQAHAKPSSAEHPEELTFPEQVRRLDMPPRPLTRTLLS